MVASQHTMKQSKIDLANTRDYCQARILGWLAAVEGRARNLAIENAKALVPQARGWGHTRRADRYFAQKAVGTPAQSLLCIRLGRPARRIFTPPGSRLRLIMRVKNRRVAERIQWDILSPLWPHPIMTLTICNVVIQRIETKNAGIRSTVTGERVVRPMLRSRETGGVAG